MHVNKAVKISIRSCIAALFALVFATGTASPDVKMPSIFGSHMVLQRFAPIPVWGTADPGERVTVTLEPASPASAEKTLSAKAKAGKDGRWKVKLGALPAGGPWRMTVTGMNTLVFDDVLVGEVWVCSGQSNMWWQLGSVRGVDTDVAAANYPNLRYFSVALTSREEPQFDFPGVAMKWTACSPGEVKKFSAVSFFFGREIHRELDVPVGLIHSSWGGSIAEAWTRPDALRSRPELRPIVDNIDSLKAVYPEAQDRYKKHAAEVEEQRKAGKPVLYTLPPRGPGERDWPAGLWNAMIAPMVPYAIRGAIWYQGESNSVRAAQYRTLFPTMIRDWRKAWGQGNFPFLFVQLANWNTEVVPVEGTWGSWPELREAQSMTLRLPATGMAVAIDIGDSTNIHPNNKVDVGRRLARCALGIAYKKNIEWNGPVYRSMKREGNAVRLLFDHASGLTASGGAPTGFEIAGTDRVFHRASAVIEGSAVVVSSPEVSAPVAVRYGWDDNPYCNLYNGAGLPASPFRTDSWQGITEGKYRPAQ